MSVTFPGTNFEDKGSPYSVNDNVKLIQEQLNSLGYVPVLKVDGKYGPLTATNVRSFQTRVGIEVDGIVGKITWDKLFENVSVPTKTIQDTITEQGNLSLKSEKFIGKSKVGGSVLEHQRGLNAYLDLNKVSQASEKATEFHSYIINLATNTWIPLPVVPESASEGVSAIWNETQIPGRSASYRSYKGTSNRSLNFSIKLHMDLLKELSTEDMDLTTICDYMKSLVYPEYSQNAILPPVCILKLTDYFKLRGTFDSISVSYELPLRDIVYRGKSNQKMYSVATVGIQFTEVPIKAPSASQIANGKVFW